MIRQTTSAIVILLLLAAGNVFASGSESFCRDCENCRCSASHDPAGVAPPAAWDQLNAYTSVLAHQSRHMTDCDTEQSAGRTNDLLSDTGDRPHFSIASDAAAGRIGSVMSSLPLPIPDNSTFYHPHLTARLLC